MCAEAESLEGVGAFASAEDRESAQNAAGALSMNEAAFRAFYERTAPQLRAYLRRASGNSATADDLLQECYLRLLRARMAPTEEAHRRHYLFRIAANLLTDHFRGTRRHAFEEFDETNQVNGPAHANLDVERAMEEVLSRLKPKERSLLWLAYVEGYRHEEIAQILRCRAASVRPMLFRARQRLAKLLRAGGWKRTGRKEERP